VKENGLHDFLENIGLALQGRTSAENAGVFAVSKQNRL